MFQAEKEKQVFETLNAYVVDQGLDFRVSVVTGPSGSYKEDDISAFLDQFLREWPPGDKQHRWDIFRLDASAPHLTNSCYHKCWQRGYVLITHGDVRPMIRTSTKRSASGSLTSRKL